MFYTVDSKLSFQNRFYSILRSKIRLLLEMCIWSPKRIEQKMPVRASPKIVKGVNSIVNIKATIMLTSTVIVPRNFGTTSAFVCTTLIIGIA